MNKKKDFESIGRYVDASERVSSLVSRRHDLAIDIERLLGSAKSTYSYKNEYVSRFNHPEAVEKMEELARVNVDLDIAISEMDAYAAAANRKPVRRSSY